jgi:dTDP-4-dehydrorhamnose 3,5-epimerase
LTPNIISDMFEFDPLPLSGAFTITLPAFADNRGSFTKVFHEGIFRDQQIQFDLKESYCSVSRKDVIRGMHFQLPPHQHAKIVFCPHGALLDVLVDLRKSSSSYGAWCSVELSEANHKAVYIPEGFAHGFKALTENAITYYLVSSVYDAAHDTGILYNSFGMDWECPSPEMSERDRSFPCLKDFESPF